MQSNKTEKSFRPGTVIVVMSSSRLWARYQAVLHRYPLPTKMSTATCLWGTTDYITQRLEHYQAQPTTPTAVPLGFSSSSNSSSSSSSSSGPQATAAATPFVLDSTRTARQCLFGLAVNAPTVHFWWGFMERMMPLRNTATTIKKVALDQLVAAPLYLGFYHTYTGAMQGEGPEQVKQRVCERLPTTMQGCWSVWPFVHFFNFKYVSLHNRPLVSQCTNLFFLLFISYIGNKKAPATNAALANDHASQAVPATVEAATGIPKKMILPAEQTEADHVVSSGTNRLMIQEMLGGATLRRTAVAACEEEPLPPR